MDTKLYTEKGDAYCQKVDIFKGKMWFAYANDTAHWHMIDAEQVKEIIEINKAKKKVASLEEFVVETVSEDENIEKNFQNAVGQDSLTRFDKPKRKKRPTNNKKKKQPVAKEGGNTNANEKQPRQAKAGQGGNSGNKGGNRNNNPQGKGGNNNKGKNPRNNRNRKPNNSGNNGNNEGKK